MPSKKTSPLWNTSKELLEIAVKNSYFYKEVGEKIGVKLQAESYKTLRNVLDFYKINYCHIKDNRKHRGFGKLSLEKFYSELKTDSILSQTILKSKIIKLDLIKYQCEKCTNTGNWCNEKLNLHLDHKNGINNDNRLDNLRFLCPNCHSQTDTYCKQKNTKFGKCVHCNKLCNQHYKRCNNCKKIKTQAEIDSKFNLRRVIRPSKEELAKLLWEKPTSTISKIYNVSDTTISKWAKSYELTKPSRGYWEKLYALDKK